MKLAKLSPEQATEILNENLNFIKIGLIDRYNADSTYVNELLEAVVTNCKADLPETKKITEYCLDNLIPSEELQKIIAFIGWHINYKTIDVTLSVLTDCIKINRTNIPLDYFE